MMRYRVVFDTNIYISAILFGGVPEKVLNLAHSEVVDIFISKQILAEIIKVLQFKFGWSRTQLAEVEAEIKRLTYKIDSKSKVKVVKSDPEDNKFLEAAIGSKSEFIISGDKHLLDLKSYKNIKIITAKTFFDLIGSY